MSDDSFYPWDYYSKIQQKYAEDWKHFIIEYTKKMDELKDIFSNYADSREVCFVATEYYNYRENNINRGITNYMSPEEWASDLKSRGGHSNLRRTIYKDKLIKLYHDPVLAEEYLKYVSKADSDFVMSHEQWFAIKQKDICALRTHFYLTNEIKRLILQALWRDYKPFLRKSNFSISKARQRSSSARCYRTRLCSQVARCGSLSKIHSYARLKPQS